MMTPADRGIFAPVPEDGGFFGRDGEFTEEKVDAIMKSDATIE